MLTIVESRDHMRVGRDRSLVRDLARKVIFGDDEARCRLGVGLLKLEPRTTSPQMILTTAYHDCIAGNRQIEDLVLRFA